MLHLYTCHARGEAAGDWRREVHLSPRPPALEGKAHELHVVGVMGGGHGARTPALVAAGEEDVFAAALRIAFVPARTRIRRRRGRAAVVSKVVSISVKSSQY